MRATTLLSTAVLIAGGERAAAQTLEWAAPMSGLWNVSANWAPAETGFVVGDGADFDSRAVHRCY